MKGSGNFLAMAVLFSASFAFAEEENTNITEEAVEKAASAVNDRCERPRRPDVPDGDTAAEDALVAAQSRVRDYITSGNEYMECLEQKRAEYGEDLTEAQEYVITRLHNSLVEEQYAVQEEWSGVVKAYQARQN
jgi:hypothetical protein